MSIEFLSSVPDTDPGSEGGIGFDYQWQVTSRLCIEMLSNPESIRIVCEYGEDITLHKNDSLIEKIQVKKRETGSWTFPELIKPAKKQKMGILAKLFEPLQDGKNVDKLRILGCGKVGTSRSSDCSLSELIALLNIPQEERNAKWDKALLPFTSYLVVCWLNDARNSLPGMAERSRVGHPLKTGDQPCVVGSPKNSS